MLSRFPLLAVVAGVLLAGGWCHAPVASAEEAGPLVQLLPEDANMLAIVRVSDVMQTPLAVKEEWARAADEKFLSGSGGIPSWVGTLVVGSRVRLSVPEEIWSSSVATVPPELTVERIAQRDNLIVDSTLGDTVRTSRGGYVTSVASGILAVRKPALRQEAAAWFADIRAKRTGPRSAYLQEASRAAGHLVLAMDLSNVLEPQATRQHLQLRPELAADPPRLERVAGQLGGLRGATLSITISTGIAAEVRVDLQQPVVGEANVLRDFIVDLLNHSGAAIDELQTCEALGDGNTLRLRTSLGDDSLRRIVSLITSFPAHGSAEEIAAAARPSPPVEGGNIRRDPPAVTVQKASRKYMDAANKLLDDLDRANRKATNYEKTAAWHERYAKKLEDLPTKDVESALVDYSRALANEVRALGRSLQGEQVQVNVQQQALTYNMNYTPGWASVDIWGGVGYGEAAVNVQSNLQQVREKQAAAVAAGAQQREQIWQIIANQRTAIDKVMRDKYGQYF